MAKEKMPADGGPDTVIDLEGGVGSSPATGPSPTEVAFDEWAMVTPPLHEEDLELGEDLFVWPHPTNSSEALFMVDDVAKRVTREATS